VDAVNATASTHGTVSLTAGNVTYTPDANYNGPASFTYHVCDNGTTNGSPDPKCDTGTVNVDVTAVNDAPTAATDSKSTAEDTALTFPASDLTTNDSKGPANESGQTLTVDAVNATASTHGTVSLTAGNVTHTPDANYTGPASFTYHVCDNGTTNGSPDPKCDTGTVNVDVTPVNDAPAPVPAATATAGHTALTCPPPTVSTNDTTAPTNENSPTTTVT